MMWMKIALLLAFASALPGATYLVSLDTTPLGTDPFYLDFQLNSGDDDAPNANNEVTVGDFNLFGGSLIGAPVLTGGASGSFPSGFTLVDTDFTNSALIQFTPGSMLSFTLTFTENFTAGTPDQFSFAVLDEGFNSIVSTGLGASLVIDIDESPAIETFPADSVYGNIEPNISTIPEPGSWMLLLSGAGALVLRSRFRSAA